MIQEPQHAHLAGLNRYRNYLAATQWDLSYRELVGRTISKAGYIHIQPDVYSFEHRMRLLRYLLTLDAVEADRAEEHAVKLYRGEIEDTESNRELCELQFEMISPQQLIAIDFQLGLHHACPHAHPAITQWFEVRTLGRRYEIPDVPEPAVKSPIPSYGWYEVGQFDKLVPTEGLRDFANEVWNPYLHPDRISAYAQTTEGDRVTYFEEEDLLTVDAELACSFITCTFDVTYLQQARFFSGLEGSRFLLNEGILKLPKGMSAKYQHMAKRGEYFYNLMEKRNIAPQDLETYLKSHSISDKAHQLLLDKEKTDSYPLLSLFESEPEFVLA